MFAFVLKEDALGGWFWVWRDYLYYCFRCRRKFFEPETLCDNPSSLWGGEERWHACPWCTSEYFEAVDAETDVVNGDETATASFKSADRYTVNKNAGRACSAIF